MSAAPSITPADSPVRWHHASPVSLRKADRLHELPDELIEEPKKPRHLFGPDDRALFDADAALTLLGSAEGPPIEEHTGCALCPRVRDTIDRWCAAKHFALHTVKFAGVAMSVAADMLFANVVGTATQLCDGLAARQAIVVAAGVVARTLQTCKVVLHTCAYLGPGAAALRMQAAMLGGTQLAAAKLDDDVVDAVRRFAGGVTLTLGMPDAAARVATDHAHVLAVDAPIAGPMALADTFDDIRTALELAWRRLRMHTMYNYMSVVSMNNAYTVLVRRLSRAFVVRASSQRQAGAVFTRMNLRPASTSWTLPAVVSGKVRVDKCKSPVHAHELYAAINRPCKCAGNGAETCRSHPPAMTHDQAMAFGRKYAHDHVNRDAIWRVVAVAITTPALHHLLLTVRVVDQGRGKESAIVSVGHTCWAVAPFHMQEGVHHIANTEKRAATTTSRGHCSNPCVDVYMYAFNGATPIRDSSARTTSDNIIARIQATVGKLLANNSMHVCIYESKKTLAYLNHHALDDQVTTLSDCRRLLLAWTEHENAERDVVVASRLAVWHMEMHEAGNTSAAHFEGLRPTRFDGDASVVATIRACMAAFLAGDTA